MNATPNVEFSYDPYFLRRVSMTDGNRTTSYSYIPVGSLGALQLQQESGPLSNSTIDYTYDELGRGASQFGRSRAIQRGLPTNFCYGRISFDMPSKNALCHPRFVSGERQRFRGKHGHGVFHSVRA